MLRALPIRKYSTLSSIDEIRARQLIEIDRVQSRLDNVHKYVSSRSNTRREREIRRHNSKTNLQPANFYVGNFVANFYVGDFVLVRTAQPIKRHKLSFLWRGPKRIMSTKSDLVYETEDLVSGKRETVHAKRLKLYRAGMVVKPVEDSLLAHAEHSTCIY